MALVHLYTPIHLVIRLTSCAYHVSYITLIQCINRSGLA